MRIGGMGLAWETRRGSTMDFEVALIPGDGRTVLATGGVVVRDCGDARIGLMGWDLMVSSPFFFLNHRDNQSS
jgi:hypothetical protein